MLGIWGSVPGQEIKIPHARGQPGPWPIAPEPGHTRDCVRQLEKACAPQQRPSTAKIKSERKDREREPSTGSGEGRYQQWAVQAVPHTQHRPLREVSPKPYNQSRSERSALLSFRASNWDFCFIDYAKVFDCVDHKKLWKILKEMGIPDHLTCLLRNLYAGQEATVRIGQGTMNWFQIGKGVHQGCILSPCLFNLYAEYIMGNVGLDESQAGINISGRNISDLRYADDTTLMAENEDELKSLLMKVKEESKKVGLELNI